MGGARVEAAGRGAQAEIRLPRRRGAPTPSAMQNTFYTAFDAETLGRAAQARLPQRVSGRPRPRHPCARLSQAPVEDAGVPVAANTTSTARGSRTRWRWRRSGARSAITCAAAAGRCATISTSTPTWSRPSAWRTTSGIRRSGTPGERTLQELMRPYGGFEGNAQTLHLLTETIYQNESGVRGMQPTRALLDGVLKYKKLFGEFPAPPPQHFLYDPQRVVPRLRLRRRGDSRRRCTRARRSTPSRASSARSWTGPTTRPIRSTTSWTA